MHIPPDPDPQTLLPPLLACLPTAFISSRPPPALLLLLSPIIRQRITLLSNNSSNYSPSDPTQNWLSHLTWTPSRAATLVETVSNLHLEPHPVSGEIELFDPANTSAAPITCSFRRLDAETLHARCALPLYSLAVLWIWCEADSGGTGIEGLSGLLDPSSAAQAPDQKTEDAWRVAEVRALDADDEAETWLPSIIDAENAYLSQTSQEEVAVDEDDGYWGRYDAASPPPAAKDNAPTAQKPRPAPTTARTMSATELDYYAQYDAALARTPSASGRSPAPAATQAPPPRRPTQPTPPLSKSSRQHSVSSDTNDAYWARYDATPGPSRQGSTAGVPTRASLRRGSSNNVLLRGQEKEKEKQKEEEDYFARYAGVQPALDAHDPDEDAGVQSSLGGLLSPGAHGRAELLRERQHAGSFAGTSPGYTGASPGYPAASPGYTTGAGNTQGSNQGLGGGIGLLRVEEEDSDSGAIHSPSPERPGSAAGSVEMLEERAAAGSVVEAGIKQHISSEIKSLFMLSQKVGIERAEFERVVRRELEVLGLIEL